MLLYFLRPKHPSGNCYVSCFLTDRTALIESQILADLGRFWQHSTMTIQKIQWFPLSMWIFGQNYISFCIPSTKTWEHIIPYCGSRCATFLAITRPIFERLCIYNLEPSWASFAYCWLKTQPLHIDIFWQKLCLVSS